MRAEQLFPQLEQLPRVTAQDMRQGLYRVLLGLFKKAAIADFIAGYSDLVFRDYAALSATEILLGFYAYTLQIYFDFSGYSDIAIGLARMLGFRLPENFNAPYKARSISEFWQRWHMTLSTWLRDYLYIPLGGNRQGPARRDLSLLVTMLVGGLWHGAAWQFVIWGGAHGLGLIVHKRCQRLAASLPRVAAWFITFHFVVLSWTLFRAESLGAWWQLIARGTMLSASEVVAVIQARRDLVLLMFVCYLVLLVPSGWQRRLQRWFELGPVWARAVLALVVVQVVLQLRSAEIRPFIYFQF